MERGREKGGERGRERRKKEEGRGGRRCAHWRACGLLVGPSLARTVRVAGTTRCRVATRRTTMTRPTPLSTDNVRLTQRDLDAVRWIAEQQAVRLDTIGRLLASRGTAVDGRALRRLAQRWDAAGLIRRRRILANAPSILWPTADGVRSAGITLKAGQRAEAPSIGTLHHTLALAEVRLVYERMGFTWTAERFLRAAGSGHRADGLAVKGDQRVLVEVERTQKERERLADILRSNLRTPGISETHYWITEVMRGVVEAAAAELEADLTTRVRVALLPEVVR